jgi:hypothetical protein
MAMEVVPGTIPVSATGAALPLNVQLTAVCAPATWIATGAATATIAPMTQAARAELTHPLSERFTGCGRGVMAHLPIQETCTTGLIEARRIVPG